MKWNKTSKLIGWVAILVALDQVVKYLIKTNLAVGEEHSIIPNVLSLTHLKNDGAAWSILAGNQLFLIIITIIALGVLGWFYFDKQNQRFYPLGLTLMIAGTIGNFIDRLIYHNVVDMFQLDFINFPIFNVADMCLTVGVAIVLLAIIKDDM